MQTIELSREEAASYLINRSFLNKKAKSVTVALGKLRCIQVDPINVVAKNHHLALWNRVENFSPEIIYNELYKKRSLFEYWLQLFSIIPLKYYPFFAPRVGISHAWHNEFASKHGKEIKMALSYVKRHGVTAPKDLNHTPGARSPFSWSGVNSRTAPFEYLWDRGELMIHHRRSNQKYYDLRERILPKDVLRTKVSKEDSIKFFLESNFDYLGLLRASFLTHARLGYIKFGDIKNLFQNYLKSGKIAEVKISGIKRPYFILKRQLPELISSKGMKHKGLVLTPPLDPLIIDRTMLKEIFGFDYMWEAYTPSEKRKFGYYAMPILYKGKFVGQIDLRKQKEGKIKILKLSSKEKSPAFKFALERKLKELEKFVEKPETV